MKLHHLSLLLFLSFALNLDAAQLLSRPKSVVPKGDVVVYDGSKIKHKPGDVFGIAAGNRKKLVIQNFTGSALKPILFYNHNGLVDINNPDIGGGAIDIKGCNHVRLAGIGKIKPSADPLAKSCGIRIACGKKGPHALNVVGRSSHIEIDHIEVYGAGFAGFNVKDEPSIERKTTRDDFVMYNISIHDNYVHNTKGEGFYIGHTFYDGYDPKKTGKPIFPHVIKGLRVYNNQFRDTGCEAIQIGSTVEDCEVYNNTIIRTGCDPFAQWQDNGMQIGAGTQARVYNNYISDSPGNSMIVFGEGDVYIYNNILVNGKSGLYCNTKGGDSYYFLNNTVVKPKADGISIGNWRKPPADVIALNNLFVMDGASGVGLLNQNKKAQISENGNVVVKDISKAGFINAEEYDYRITQKSPAKGKGVDVSNYGIKADMHGVSRFKGRQVDAGACAYSMKQSSVLLGAPLATSAPKPWKNK